LTDADQMLHGGFPFWVTSLII